jgi:hypothetical protein
MTNKILHNLLVLFIGCLAVSAYAQDIPAKNWDVEKIKGVCHLPYTYYKGSPYLTDTWLLGKIELKDGVIIDSLHLQYSSYKDELIYYNKEVSAKITIDKLSLKGFSFVGTDGRSRVFRKFYYDNFEKGDRFFEVLADGETMLLAYRKVSLETAEPYIVDNVIMKNMIYSSDFSYYFYSPQKGYTSIRMNKMSLLSKFDKVSQKAIKKLLRKSRIRVYDEQSFTLAWESIEKEGYKVVF